MKIMVKNFLNKVMIFDKDKLETVMCVLFECVRNLGLNM